MTRERTAAQSDPLHGQLHVLHCAAELASAPLPGSVIAVRSSRFALGRGRECDLSLAHRTISRRHALIVCEDERYYLVDAGSTNGTFLNSRRLEANEHRPLATNDTVWLAEVFSFRFVDPGQTVAQERVLPMGLVIDRLRREVFLDRCLVPLSAQEFDLLALLQQRAGDVVDRDTIAAALWPADLMEGVTENMIDTTVSRLRRKLRVVNRAWEELKTVRDVGYRLEPPLP